MTKLGLNYETPFSEVISVTLEKTFMLSGEKKSEQESGTVESVENEDLFS